MFKFRSKQEKANESLLAYAARGDVLYPAFKELFTKQPRPDLTVTDAEGRTALHLAAMAGGLKDAELLLSQGAALDAKDTKGNTPLMSALANGFDEVSAFLMKAGASLDAVNEKDETPAAIAAQSAAQDVLILLPYLKKEKTIDEMIRVHAQATADRQVIATAKEFTDVGELQKALDAGGNPNAVDSGGYSALLWAATRYDPGEIELLVARGAEVNFQNTRSSLYTPLMAAVARGNTRVAEKLLKAGANISLKNEHGKTAYDIALQQGKPEAARLIAQEERRLVQSEDEKTAAQKKIATADLQASVIDNDPFGVNAALKQGADIWLEMPNGFNLLTYAAQSPRRNPLLALLIEKGANPDTPDTKGRIAIVTAAGEKNGLAVRALIDAGANVNARDAGGHNALSCIGTDDSRTLDKLIAAKADPNVHGKHSSVTFIEAMSLWEGGTHIIKALIAAGAAFDRQGKDGNTPLMISLRAGWRENAQTFLDAGASVTVTNEKGETPLDLARSKGLVDIAARIALLQQAQTATVEAPAKSRNRGSKASGPAL